MSKLVRNGGYRNIITFRSSICGFRRRDPLVCCQAFRNTRFLRKSPESESKNKISNLLPRKCGHPMIRNKIFGGRPTPIGAYPWLAALGYRVPNMDGYIFDDCSGSIINDKYVLTAAHCVHRKYTGRRRLAVVQLGTWNLATNEDCNEDRNFRRRRCYPHLIVGVDDVIIHPDFDEEAESAHDIALIRLNATLDFNRDDNVLIEPVCLPPSGMQLRDLTGRMAIAAGWGLTEHRNKSTVLMSVELPIVNSNLCLQRYRSEFVGKQLCAGGKKGRDTCIGDSGGPLVLSESSGPLFTQVGIVSFGQAPCGAALAPGVYTFVAIYRDWIEESLKP